MKDFDSTVMPRMLGLPDREAYYAACSSFSDVSRVTIPLLVLHAADDPLIETRQVPVTQCAANPHVVR